MANGRVPFSASPRTRRSASRTRWSVSPHSRWSVSLRTRRVAASVAILLAVSLAGAPAAALGAGGVTTTAQAVRGSVTLLNGLGTLPLATRPTSWTTGGATDTAGTPLNVANPLGGTSLLGTTTVSATSQAAAGGGRSSARVEGLSLLGASTLSAGVVSSNCLMTSTGISGGTDTANLKIGNAAVNPGVNSTVGVDNVLTGTADRETATYDTSSHRLVFTVRGLDLTLLGGLSVVAGGAVVVAESVCTGTVDLGGVTTGPKTILLGRSDTPTVTVANSGDVAAPGTTISIPAPPTGYTIGAVTTTGGGSCAGVANGRITCTGVTVPGNGAVTVSLPTTIDAGAGPVADWTPASSSITAVSTPVAALPGTRISAAGAGPLVIAQAPHTTGSTITITPASVPAGRSATTTISVSNAGPSDATGASLTIPIGTAPDGLSVDSATVAGRPCTVGASISCTGLSIPSGGSVGVSVTVTAAAGAAVGTAWDLAGLTASVNDFTATGQGRFVTVAGPDVNLSGGVTVTGATAVPGGDPVGVLVRVADTGAVAATGTTVTVPAPPAGYTIGTVTSSGGGTCTGGSAGVRCTGVTVPAGGSVTIAIDVSLSADVTAHWSAVAAVPVTATSGDSTGRATGRIVIAEPRWTLGITSTGPAPGTTGSGDTTTVTVTVGDNGPSDAVDAGFSVVAPTDTTFRSFDGSAAPYCRLAATTLVTCAADIPAGGTALVLRLSVKISDQADPGHPLDDGCVSLDGDTTCGGPDDEPLFAITLRTGLNRRLTVTEDSATVTPGRDGTARLRLESTTDESDLTVRIPLRPVPSGYSVTAATTTTGVRCTTTADAVTCAGVTLTAGTPEEIRLRVALDASVEPPSSWPVTGITVTDGTDTVTINGTLAVAGTPIWDVTGTFTGPDDHTVPPGGTADLDVTLHNDGPSDAKQITVVVLAPESSTFNPPTGDAATFCVRSSANTRAVCTLDLDAGADSPRLTFPITVSANADPSTPLDGGCLDLDAVAGCGGGDVALHAIVLMVPLSRQLSIEATPANVTPGTSGDATIALTADTADVDDLTVTVPFALPGGLTVENVTVDQAGAGCTADAGQVTCSGLDIAGGDTATITLHLSAASAARPGTTWTASDIAISRGPERYTVDARLAVVAAARYTLRTVYVAPANPIPPGGSGTFEIDVYNDGPSDAADSTISILAPDGGTFGAPDSTYSSYCRAVSGGKLVCRFGLPAGSTPLRFRIVLDVSPAADPSVDLDGGCVDLDNDGECGPDDPVIGPFALAQPFARKLDISTAPAVIGRSQTGTATILLTPTEALTDLTVTIPLTDKPADITAGTPVAATGGPCRVDPQSMTCTGVDVPVGGASIDIPVAVGSAAPDTAFWAADGITVSDGAGGTATGAGFLVRVAAPDYTLTADVTVPADRTVPPGGTADITVVVTNQGPGDVSGGLITVLAPYRTGFGDLGDLAQYCRKQSNNRLSCRVTLARDASISLRIGVVIAANADVNQHITGGCLDMDGDGRCRIGFGPDIAIPDIVLRAGLGDTLTLSGIPTTVTPGDDDTTTLTVHSSVTETGMVVSVDLGTLPAGLGVIGASRSDGLSCTAGDGTLRCPDVNLAAGGDLTVTLRVDVPADADPGATWQPAVTFSIPGEDYTRGVRLITVGPPVHEVTVTVHDPGTLTPGGTGTVTINLHNAGPSQYRDARYEFEAPTTTTFGPPRSPACRLISSTHVSCTRDLPLGDTELVLVLNIPPTANPGTPTSGGCWDVDADRQCTYGPDQPWPPLVINPTFANQVTVTTEAGTATPGTTASGYVVIDSAVPMTGLTVVIPKRLPTGFTLTGASGPTGSTCDRLSSATVVTCTNVDVTAGRRRAITLTVDIAPSVRVNRTWTAYSIMVSDGSGGSTETDGAIATSGPPVAPITYTVDLAGTVAAGRTVTLTVVVANAGPSDAYDVTSYVVAPANTTFGNLSGEVAADCSPSSRTLLACDFDMPAGGGDITWVIPVVVSGAVSAGDPVTGGCVSENDADCDDSTTTDHDLPAYATGRSLSEITGVAYTAATIAPGDDGAAQIVISATSDVDGLTFSVPLSGLPDEFALTSVDADTGACAVNGARSIECAGITLAAGASATITAHVSVDASLADPRTWRVVGAVLAQDDDSDSYTSSGLLVSTTAPDYDIGVTWGAPTVNPAAPGQSLVLPVRLHNNGPSDAAAYQLVLILPAGLNHGPLPPACGEGGTTRIVSCEIGLDAGDDLTLRFAVVVATTVTSGSVLTACLDNVGQPAFDYDCGDSGDLAATGIQVTSSKVDLQIHYLNPAPRSTAGGTIRLGLPYSNNGTETADDVTFTIDPPDGVRVIAADVLADASGFDDTSGDGPSPAETDPATCTASDDGDDNTVVCTGPAIPVGTTSQLWMTLFVSPGAPAGTYPATVLISTTSPEGNVTNNFATAQMTIASTGDQPDPPAPHPAPGLPNDNGGTGPGGADNLPRTGPDVAGLIVLSLMLVAGGGAARIVARNKPRRRSVPT